MTVKTITEMMGIIGEIPGIRGRVRRPEHKFSTFEDWDHFWHNDIGLLVRAVTEPQGHIYVDFCSSAGSFNDPTATIRFRPICLDLISAKILRDRLDEAISEAEMETA